VAHQASALEASQLVFPTAIAALGAHHRAEIEKWWPIIKAASIRIEQGK